MKKLTVREALRTQKETEKFLKAKNAAFKRLPKAQQRVEIANDILDMISRRSINVKSGTWLDIPDIADVAIKFDNDFDWFVDDEFNQLQVALPVLLRKRTRKEANNDCSDTICKCCALGACFLGLVDKRNDAKNNPCGFDLEDMIPYLLKVFSKEQIIMIENAFETGCGGLSVNLAEHSGEKTVAVFTGLPTACRVSCEKIEAAVAFGNEYDNDERRLKAIMSNIVKNNGEFIPPPAKKRFLDS